MRLTVTVVYILNICLMSSFNEIWPVFSLKIWPLNIDIQHYSIMESYQF